MWLEFYSEKKEGCIPCFVEPYDGVLKGDEEGWVAIVRASLLTSKLNSPARKLV
jgi:hypothetical protein